MALTGLAIAAALGLLKSEVVDRPKEDRQRKLKAEEIRLSPWSGLTPETKIEEADPFGSAIGYGQVGAQIGHGISQDKMAKDALLKKTPWTGLDAAQAKQQPVGLLGVDTNKLNAYPQYGGYDAFQAESQPVGAMGVDSNQLNAYPEYSYLAKKGRGYL